MRSLFDANRLNSELSNAFIDFEKRIPNLYKVSELYLDTNDPTKKFKSEFFLLRRFFGFLKAFLITLLKSNFNLEPRSEIKGDVLLVSPYINKIKGNNFFFGDIQNHFHNLKKTTVDLRIFNGVPPISDYLGEKDNSSLNVLYLPSLSLNENILVFKELLKTFKDFSIAIKEEKDPIKKKLLRSIKKRLFSRTNFFNFYLSAQLDNFIKENKFKDALVTFDGSPWERIFCKKFKSLNKTGRVAFYQHAPITEKSYSLFNKYPKLLNPDHIYCSGKGPHSIFLNKISFLSNIHILGSRKNIQDSQKRNFNKEESVLFITQGSSRDIFILYKIALRLAFQERKIKVKVLLHPAVYLGLSFKFLNVALEFFLSNFKCDSVSDENTFSKSKFMVYFSSSLAIEKMFYDIRPIHLTNSSNNNPLSILVDKENPNLSWCTEANDFKDILNIINSEVNLDSKVEKYSKQNAKIFSQEYFEPFQITKEFFSDY